MFLLFILLFKLTGEHSHVCPHNLPCYSIDLVDCCVVLLDIYPLIVPTDMYFANTGEEADVQRNWIQQENRSRR